MSLTMRLAAGLLSLKPKTLGSAESARAIGERDRVDAPLPAALRRLCQVTSSEHDGRSVIILVPRHQPRPVTIVYLHGGAYVNALVRPHWAIIGQLIRRTGATVIVPSYPLAPDSDAAQAYTWLAPVLRQARLGTPEHRLLLAGDSAGAGLAAGTAIHLRDTGGDAPDGLLLISPWLDVTMTNPDITSLQERDVMLGAVGLRYWGARWAGAWELRDTRVSPLYDSLEHFPATRIYQGGRDLFLPDARRFTARARAAGSDVTLKEYPDGFHVFAALTVAPEARDAFRDMSHFVARLSAS